MKRLISNFFLFLAISALSISACAKDGQEKYILDGKEYTRGEIVSFYIEVAYTSKVWNEDVRALNFDNNQDQYITLLDYFTDPYEPKIPFKWMQEFASKKDNWPRAGALIKWAKEDVPVKINWPQTYPLQEITGDTYNFYKNEISQTLQTKTSQLFKLVDVEETKRKSDGNVDLNYYSNSDPFGLWIIPLNHWVTRGLMGSQGYNPDPDEYENMLWGAINSEGSIWKYQDIYFLADARNNIDVTICKIRTDINTEMQQHLVNECLVRGHGFPGIINNNLDSYLSKWKDTAEDKALKVSEFDNFMIELHQCPKLQAGMDKNAVIKALIFEKSCF